MAYVAITSAWQVHWLSRWGNEASLWLVVQWRHATVSTVESLVRAPTCKAHGLSAACGKDQSRPQACMSYCMRLMVQCWHSSRASLQGNMRV